MGRFLNIGVIQMPVSTDTAENLRYLTDRVDQIMSGYHKPELVIGVEGGIGYYTPQAVPGPITDYLGKIAERHGIYFIPGTMYRTDDDLPDGRFYNAAPIFSPRGELIAVYDKMAPWIPSEACTQPGKHYVVFDIPEKDTKIGVSICYDSVFPEISRNLMLMGAEVIVKIAQDPWRLRDIGKPIHRARAIENQCYYVATNGVGPTYNFTMYGESQVIDPEGRLIWELSDRPTLNTAWLDLDMVKRCRTHGSLLMDHYVQHYGLFNPPMPYAGKVRTAPVYRDLPDPVMNEAAYDERMASDGFYMPMKKNGEEFDLETVIAGYQESLDRFLKG